MEHEEISYKDFLKLLKSVSIDRPSRQRSAAEVFVELCFDFPQLPAADIKILHEDFLQQLQKNDGKGLATFPLSNSFLSGVVYGASRWKTVGEALPVAGELGDEGRLPVVDPTETKMYQSLAAVVFVKLFRNALRATSAELSRLLSDVEPADESATHDVIELAADDSDSPTHYEDLKAEESDGDDYVYEPYGHAHEPVIPAAPSRSKPVDLGWPEIQQRLLHFSDMLSYDLLSSLEESEWTALGVTLDIVQIAGLLRAHAHLRMADALATYVFVLR
eukprot:TRINITY_DN15147_c0_g1_i2.p2 TRINITY_DN15147_c0_g1~~TRINITY_DN15147_c0_g1_i2.p2  ORF type:complete len:276 (-),score=68.94 TRINITY_DN15147_c0_g1_i2:885-1712(-)